MDYTEVRFYNNADLNEAIIAWLAEYDFDMFEERLDGVNAYIEAKRFKEEDLSAILALIPGSEENIRYETTFIKDQNWNKKWESNFEPVLIAGKVYIRAPFHEKVEGYEFEIIIEPKMSFGTGHHDTTSLMIELMLQNNFEKKAVLDMGCGTALLAILAKKLRAGKITAIDIDEWAFTNSLENIERNEAADIAVIQGDVHAIGNEKYDIILANINRNILLSDIPSYYSAMYTDGEIFLSGILTGDKDIIDQCATGCGLTFVSEASHNNWLALHYKKNQ